jgi:holo-[acyl-carrier protein] synthase
MQCLVMLSARTCRAAADSTSATRQPSTPVGLGSRPAREARRAVCGPRDWPCSSSHYRKAFDHYFIDNNRPRAATSAGAAIGALHLGLRLVNEGKVARSPARVGACSSIHMIIGIGTDICDARRIAQTIERDGELFLDRVYTPIERAKAERGANRIETYAKCFAAKEAFAKALGTGLLHAGVLFRDIEVVNLPSGKPTLKLTGGALKQLQAITPEDCEAQIDLALTDEGPYAQAFVIISASPRSLARLAQW